MLSVVPPKFKTCSYGPATYSQTCSWASMKLRPPFTCHHKHINATISFQYAPQIKLSADTNGTEKLLVIIFSALVSFFVLGLMVSALCYFCYWKKRRKTDANESVEGLCFILTLISSAFKSKYQF